MSFRELPPWAAWRHLGAREGFEVTFLRTDHDGHRLEGATTAVEESQAWFVGYTIALNSDGLIRSAVVSGTSAADGHELRLEADDAGLWRRTFGPWISVSSDSSSDTSAWTTIAAASATTTRLRNSTSSANCSMTCPAWCTSTPASQFALPDAAGPLSRLWGARTTRGRYPMTCLTAARRGAGLDRHVLVAHDEYQHPNQSQHSHNGLTDDRGS